ncbi:MAG: cysteine-rich small domain-containing protein [Clostridia bacterium]|nr:cysteine-rich small domain-containing protein [Clostridia bacterium]
MEASHKFFRNEKCAYFPCHEGIREERFNCLFCFCPLYAMGRDCGGAFRYTAGGVKDCSDCVFPHIPENYEAVLEKLRRAAEDRESGA